MEKDPFFGLEGDLDAARGLVATIGPELGEVFVYPGDRHLFTDSSLPFVRRGRDGTGAAALAAVARPGQLTGPAPLRWLAMASNADPRVDAYIDALPAWQRAVCQQVRSLVHAADPAVEETVKRRVQPYFVLHGNICALLATKDHVNVFLYDGAIVPDPEHIITGGHDNKTARTVAIYRGEPINAPALTAMFRQIIANNRAGGWRRLKNTGQA